ncbi:MULTISPECIES: dipeptide ABC transporter ATP-binding protein [unclassified Micromonospora]|uniref:dipeptide ABC transporter ATP-binding protein n=1 Tax=unclassified Micromonospora TaxID=2617518 RepID=UPI0022BF006E|nr:ABC transporter ATP-binding protein [Micromonospora sp. AKA38]GHJ16126.1 putative ABC transporter ATP-binding protein [Micromonospora sp. AKA38]
MAGADAVPLLEVDGLDVTFDTLRGPVHAVRGATWSVRQGETLVVLGESGSGKSVSLHAVAGLLPANGHTAGRVRFQGRDVLGLRGAKLRRFCAENYGMVFQDPMSSLDPSFTVGDQIAEILRVHRGASAKDAWERAVELLGVVRIDDPGRRAKQYPHELSGGMRQRVMIAMAIALDPPLFLADEPTTALDTSVRGAVLETMIELRDRLSMGVVLITHDIGVAAAVADRVAVMYAGRVVEYGTAEQVLHEPGHPYTAALLGSLPRLRRLRSTLTAIPGAPPNAARLPAGCSFHPRCRFATDRCAEELPVLQPSGAGQVAACHWTGRLTADGDLGYWREGGEPLVDARPGDAEQPFVVVENLVKEYPLGSGRKARVLRAVDDVSFTIPKGTTLGLVGESGSGKSTTAMIMSGLLAPTSGRVVIGGVDIARLSGKAMRDVRRDLQVVFQDPYSSMDPRMTIGQIVDEPLLVHRRGSKAQRRDRVTELLDLVGLDGDYAARFPHQLSGGQAQRVAIARALALEPALMVLDEPVAALDLSIQAQILNLLRDLQARLGLTYLFIGHDLAAVAYISDRVAVMSTGKIVELDRVDAIYQRPAAAYTRQLLDAVLDPEADLGRYRDRPTIRREEPCVPSAPATP